MTKKQPAAPTNEVRLIGRVSGDPTARTLPSGDELVHLGKKLTIQRYRDFLFRHGVLCSMTIYHTTETCAVLVRIAITRRWRLVLLIDRSEYHSQKRSGSYFTPPLRSCASLSAL